MVESTNAPLIPSWGKKILIGAALVLLGAGAGLSTAVLVLEDAATRVTAPEDMAWIEARNAGLRAELHRLENGLDEVALGLEESQGVAYQARSLVGLSPWTPGLDHQPIHRAAPPRNRLGREVAFSNVRVRETLKEARALSRSFREVVSRMEDEAQTWASIPSTRPVEGARLSSPFGLRRDPFTGRLAWHYGMDLSVPAGTPVLACAEGTVIRAEYAGGYGKLVEIDHGNGLRTRYGHNSKIVVTQGQRVRRGQLLAYVGATGRASAPHLHYEVHLHGKPVNPEPYLLPDQLTAE